MNLRIVAPGAAPRARHAIWQVEQKLRDWAKRGLTRDGPGFFAMFAPRMLALKKAVLTDIQNRLDPHPALPQNNWGRA